MAETPKVDNLLHISWCDSMWVPHLNASNVMDYFSERSNPFYSRDCNNEFIKMQQNTRMDALTQMQGTEYMLLHAQDPILYIVRKQHRYSPSQVNPLASYHIIGGQVFQTPDIGTVINSRLASTMTHINSSFSELASYSQYHPSKGYWWHFHNKSAQQSLDQQLQASKDTKEKKVAAKEEVATLFQRRRVDALLQDISNRFPYKAQVPDTHEPPSTGNPAAPPPPSASAPSQHVAITNTGGVNSSATTTAGAVTTASTSVASPLLNIKTEDIKLEERPEMKVELKHEVKTEIKSELGGGPQQQHFQRSSSKPPPEKRLRLN
ncbi:Mediator complex subunit Med6 [Trinorchestia longiramus]|nr:Mediator complex subunit Med6 [Trinorchestia longiramus]